MQLFVIALIGLSGVSARAEIPSFAEIKRHYAARLSDATILDRLGQPLGRRRVRFGERIAHWTPLSEIPSSLIADVLKSEDRHFYAHHGVNWWSLLRGARDQLRHLSSSKKSGASTISMQVASLLNQSLIPRGRHRSWAQKITQATGALDLEKSWTKPQILEAYLNLVSFRGELRGIRSAAGGLFGRTPQELNFNQSSLLSVLIRAPSSNPETVYRRTCRLRELATDSEACRDLIDRLRQYSLIPMAYPPASENWAPHAVGYLRGLSPRDPDVSMLPSTLDGPIQREISLILRRQIGVLKSRHVQDSCALVVENATGAVRAYVGSVGALSEHGEVDGVQAYRQAGSVLKPFLYGLAIHARTLTASSFLDDSPLHLSQGERGVYRPENFDHQDHGDAQAPVSLRQALASSLNLPAVRTLDLVGTTRFLETLRQLEFTGLRDPDVYGPSLALGSADLRLWDLVQAYRVLARQGRFSPIHLNPDQLSTTNPQIFDPGAAYIISDILADPLSRSLTFGFGGPLSLPFWAAVKTGTSKDMRDNWCIGYTPRYTVGVWVGNFAGEPMWNVSGVTGAAPAWSEIMLALQRFDAAPPTAPSPPSTLRRVRSEWYMAGTEAPPEFDASLPNSHFHRILYPVDQEMVAHDPDFPSDQERIVFRASPHPQEMHLRWILNDQEIAPAATPYPWKLGPKGRYRLKLVNDRDELQHEIEFIIRR